MIYKALSIKPPWIELIISGKKWIETRTWQTNYRGKILLVSCKTADEYVARHFRGLFEPMPRGHALAIANLVDCVPMKKQHAGKGGSMCNYIPVLYSWIFKDVEAINPFPVRGQLKIYDVEVPDVT